MQLGYVLELTALICLKHMIGWLGSSEEAQVYAIIFYDLIFCLLRKAKNSCWELK